MKTCLTVLFFAFFGLAFSQENDKDYSEAIDLIEVWLEAQKDYEQLPGIMAIIVDNQQVVWSGAYGFANREEKIKATPSTLCSICSISKLFTSVAIMKLYDEGKLRLDDRIEELLPWYDLGQQHPGSGPITVRSLLTHSSGLPRENTFPHWNGPDFSSPSGEQIRSELSNQQTLYPASTYYQYSNLGLTLLGEIVAEVSGVPYEEYVQEHILNPLQLNATRPTMPQSMHGQELAVGYGVLNREGERIRMNFFEADGLAAAAGFSSNVIDLAKFAAWQFRLTDTTIAEILQPSTLRYMQKVHWTDDDWSTTWGLGFKVSKADDGSKWISHGGYCPGYKTTLQIHPKTKMAYSVMINSSGGNPTKYAHGMHDLLQKVKAGEKDEQVNLTPYKGFYEMENEEENYVSSWEGQLVLLPLPTSNPAKSMQLYKPLGNDEFQKVRDDGGLGEILSFEKDENGEISRYRVFNYIYSKRIND